jgi:hypothetical protein
MVVGYVPPGGDKRKLKLKLVATCGRINISIGYVLMDCYENVS